MMLIAIDFADIFLIILSIIAIIMIFIGLIEQILKKIIEKFKNRKNSQIY